MSTWTNFSEIPLDDLMPGEVLKASTLSQINENAKQAALTPEYFDFQDLGDGDTVDLPTSDIDGYLYSRAEMFYAWEWKSQNADSTGQHFRLPGFYATINSATGLVTIKVWRLKPGGPYVTEPDGGDADLTIRIIPIGIRKINAATVSTVTPNEPGDAGSTLADSDDDDTVNGT